MRKDTTRMYQEQEEEELRSQLGVEDRLEGHQEQQEGGRKQRNKRRNQNLEDVEPRRSLRLAKKKVTLGDTMTVDNLAELPYYMEAVENGYAGTRQRDYMTPPEAEEAQAPAEERPEEPPMREEVDGDQEGAVEQAEESLEEP